MSNHVTFWLTWILGKYWNNLLSKAFIQSSWWISPSFDVLSLLHNKMAAFVGKWKLKSCQIDNLADFMRALGIVFMLSNIQQF